MNVKQERQDEAEIRELAKKFVEANKAKMAMPQRNNQQVSQGMNLLNFLSTDKNNSSKVTTQNNSDSKLIDEESVKGRFGWTTIGNVNIPYITRYGEYYCSVRMVEMKVLNKLLSYLHQDLYNCTNIRSYYITEVEARLLTEINFKHCDFDYGRDAFTSRDLIVRLKDANEFYQFLEHCYAKLMNTVNSNSLGRCGFIRINGESVVPYTIYNDQKFVPLFYFEGETDNLKQRADKLEGWDLSYLKFCCKVQGIRNELFAHDSCSVISLNDIKNYFPPNTLFEDYWPKKNLDSQLLISRSSNPQPIIQWTRQPVAPPPHSTHAVPSPKPVLPSKTTNNSHHQVHHYTNYQNMPGQSTYHQPRVNNPVSRTFPGTSTNRMRPYYPGITQVPPPPPLVRNPNAQLPYSTPPKSGYMILEPNLNQNNFHRPSQTTFPSPLLHMNGAIARFDTSQSRDLQNNYVNNTQQMVNQGPHQVSRAQSNATSEERTNMTNGRSSSSALNNRNKLVPIPDGPPTSSNTIPYKMQKALVEGKMISCINMKPNSWSDMMVSLPDLVTNFFQNVPVQSCQQVMQVLGIEVFKANSSQVRLLTEGRCANGNETIPLVQVRNVIDFMPQLKYMLNGICLASKRQRNS